MAGQESAWTDAQLMDLALNDPGPTVDRATSLLEHAASADRIVPLRARGLARRQLGQFGESAADLEVALRLSEDLQERERWAQVALTLAGTYVHLGRVEEAEGLLQRCVAESEGRTKAEAVYQLATTAAQIGDLDRAIAGFAEALPMIRSVGERGWEANLLGNRGTVKIYSGDYEGAIADLKMALEITAETAPGPSQLCLFTNNLAYAKHLAGEVSESIALYQRAEQVQAEHGLPATMFAHRCSAYLAAGMYEETMDLAAEAFAFHRSGGAAVGAIEALLSGAAAALALGDYEKAQELAGRVPRLDSESAFPVWRARAALIGLEASVAMHQVPDDYRHQCESIFEAVQEGDAATAVQAKLVRARAALALDEFGEAALALDEAMPLCRSASLDLQAQHSELAALHAYAAGEHDRGLSHVYSGIDIYRSLVDVSPSFDVAHKAARFARRLVELGAGDLLGRGRLSDAVALTALFRGAATKVDGRSHGRPEATDAATLLTWIEIDATLWCVEVARSSIDVHECGPLAEIERAVSEAKFAYRQLARRTRLSTSAVRGALAEARACGRRLEELVLPPLSADRVVVSPSEVLHGVIWAGLPSLAERSFTVSPVAAGAWGAPLEPAGSRSVLASTALSHTSAEAKTIAQVWAIEPVLDPEPSDLERLGSVEILHLAGHFMTNARNPLLSAMHLGPSQLRGEDFSAWETTPRVLVLSGCESADVDTIGSVQVGLVSAALAGGVESVVATNSVVEDGTAVVAVMEALHKELAVGTSPADALRSIRQGPNADPVISDLLAVYGVGWWRP